MALLFASWVGAVVCFFSIGFLQTIFSIEKNKVLHCADAKTMTEKNGGNNALPRPVFWRGSRAAALACIHPSSSSGHGMMFFQFVL
jgi:hypothetical protein